MMFLFELFQLVASQFKLIHQLIHLFAFLINFMLKCSVCRHQLLICQNCALQLLLQMSCANHLLPQLLHLYLHRVLCNLCILLNRHSQTLLLILVYLLSIFNHLLSIFIFKHQTLIFFLQRFYFIILLFKLFEELILQCELLIYFSLNFHLCLLTHMLQLFKLGEMLLQDFCFE